MLKKGYEHVASKDESTSPSNVLVSHDNQQSVKQLGVFSSMKQHIQDNAINLQQSTTAQQPLVTNEQVESQDVLDINYPAKQQTKITDKNLFKTSINQRTSLRKRVIGDEFRVNTYTTSWQDNPSIATFSNGNFVVVWDSIGQDGSSGGIYGQLFDGSGNIMGGEFRVNTYTAGLQRNPSIATFSNGNFVVTWESWGQDPGDSSGQSGVYGQLFDGSGNTIGFEFQVNTYTMANQHLPSVTAFSNGNFVVTWESEGGQDGDSGGIYGQLFDGSGNTIGSEFQINTYTTNWQLNPAVAAFSNGNFVVTWESYEQDGDSTGIYSQLFDESGNKVGNEFQVNIYTTDWQGWPSVAVFSNENFVVIWHSNGQDGDVSGVYGQLFNGSGNTIGNEFQVNTYTTGYQWKPSVTVLNGNFVVVWESDQDGSGYGIYGQLFDGSGNKGGSEVQVNTYITNSQWRPSVAAFPNGNFVVAWVSDGQDGDQYGVYGRIFYGLSVLNADITHSYSEDTDYDLEIIIQIPFYASSINVTTTATFTLSDPAVGELQATDFGTALETYDALTGVWQINGLLSDVNVVLDSLYYKPTLNYNQNFTIAIWITDDISVDTSTLLIKGLPVNDAPALMNNTLTLNQGETVIIDNSNFSAFDVDNDNALLQFNLLNVAHGQFERITNPGNPINTFLQQQIMNRDIQFVHDDSIDIPSYQIQVSDGNANASTMAGIVNFNRKPIIKNNMLSINENGETVVLTSSNLKASDVDNEESTLLFTVSDIAHGQFELVNTPNTEISSFIQQDIFDTNVQFIHDGSYEKPAYNVKVSDGKVNSTTEPAIINFFGNTTVINPSDQDTNGKQTNIVPPVVGAIAGAVGIGLVVGVGFWRYRTHRANTEYRNQYPLANKLYEKLHLNHLDNFKTEAGQEFVSTVNRLKTLFSDKGYEVDNMASDAIDDFSTYVAKTINMHVTVEKTRFGGQKIDMADVTSKADRIVKNVKDVIEEDGWVPRQAPVTEKFDL